MLGGAGFVLGGAGFVLGGAGFVLGGAGFVLGLCWEVLGLCWEVLGLCWEVLGLCWEVLGSCWEVLGSCWEVLGFCPPRTSLVLKVPLLQFCAKQKRTHSTRCERGNVLDVSHTQALGEAREETVRQSNISLFRWSGYFGIFSSVVRLKTALFLVVGDHLKPIWIRFDFRISTPNMHHFLMVCSGDWVCAQRLAVLCL